MRLGEIQLRDPFILPYHGWYYMYGSRVENRDYGVYQNGCDVYKSCNLIDWSEAKLVIGDSGTVGIENIFWAPEVHIYEDKFYMFVTVKKGDEHRGTYIYAADSPEGEFIPFGEKKITPEEWECLDGTLYIEDGTPYMVFCHEWTQVHDGEMCAVELSRDLKKAVGEPQLLFKASDTEWSKEIHRGDYVTDGPLLFKKNGILYMLWSGYDSNGYVQALSYTKSGKLFGKWEHNHELLYDKDGGHGMVFTDFENNKKVVLHTQNCTENNRPVIFDFVKQDVCLYKLK